MTYYVGKATTLAAVLRHLTLSAPGQRHLRAGGAALSIPPRGICSLVIACTLLAVLATGARPTAALGCTVDAECDDGLFCNGSETCPAGTCVAGDSVDCSAFADQCNDAVCTEAQQECVVTPKIDGFGCDDDDQCTLNDICQAGECVVNIDGDADDDGYCDAWETVAGCSSTDFFEIPPQANVYSGGKLGVGEALLTFKAPSTRKLSIATEPTCATAGVCDPAIRFCSSGKVGDPCTVDGDCNQPPRTCRVVINYGAVLDLTMVYANLRIAGTPSSVVLSSFEGPTPGCSRKMDIQLPTGFFRRAKLRLKAAATMGGRVRRDRDRFVYLP